MRSLKERKRTMLQSAKEPPIPGLRETKDSRAQTDVGHICPTDKIHKRSGSKKFHSQIAAYCTVN